VGVSARLTRRGLIQWAGLAGGAALLEACAPAAPATAPTATAPASAPTRAPTVASAPAPAGSPSAAASAVASPASASRPAASSLLPVYQPNTTGPKPDFPAANQNLCDGFSKYPTNPVKALPADPPGLGSTVTIFSDAALPLPTPLDQNPAWQAVNKALNANVQYNIASNTDYPAKLATVMAGGDLPDVISFVTITPGSTAVSFVPGGQQFLQAKAADLTPFLAGDAAKAYPNLAAIPTHCWQNAGCAYQGKLYMIPFQRTLAGILWLKNATLYDAQIGADYVPKDAADFKRILQALSKPQQNVWGIGGGSGTLWLTYFSALFGAPNGWRLAADGTLTNAYETDEYKAATSYVRDLWSSGVFHPDSPANLTRTDWQAGKFVVFLDTFNGWQDSLRHAPAMNPAPDFKLLPLFAAQAGQKPSFFTIGGYGGTIAFKQASAERIQELLRIANWLAAPFGSAEDLLLSYGVQDRDYSFDSAGTLTLTPQSNTDANYVPWKYTAQHPYVFFAPDLPTYGAIATQAEAAVVPFGVADPTFGAVSQTAALKGVALTNTMNDNLSDVVLGHRPFSDFDQIVSDWRTNGGEQMRKEFQAALASG
jgi:putative aldouronate transport system substrate-binding protein